MTQSPQASSHISLKQRCALDQLMHQPSLPTAITNGAIDLSCQLTAHSPLLQPLLMHVTPYLLSSSPSGLVIEELGIVERYGSHFQ